MFPISDKNPHQNTPWVNYLLIAVNILFFVCELILGDQFIDKWSFVAARFMENPFSEIPTIFTSMFMHAGWLHIGGNMLYLWIFGDNIEDRLGHLKYLVFYLVCGVVAVFSELIFNLNSQIPMLGASGAVAGVLAAYIFMFPLVPVRVFIGCLIAPLPALVVIGIWILLQFFYGVGSLGSAAEGGVAYMAHIGGFITGLILIIFLRLSGQIKR